MFDTIIIGGGPAGVTAALYLVRLKKNILIITNDQSSLNKAEVIDNYYGLHNISGLDLYLAGLNQAKAMNINIIKEEVLDIEKEGNFTVSTVNNKYQAKTVIMATGVSRNKPGIKNLDLYDGKGVSYCATCDGFFFRNKKIAVIGSGAYALHEANHLLNISDDVTIYTNGEEPKFETNINVVKDKILEIEKDNNFKLVGLNKYEADGIFIALGVASAGSFAKKLGLAMNGSYLEVDSNFKTYIEGLYAIGDCIGGFLQISKAIYEGSLVSIEVNKYLRGINNDR